MGLINTSAHKKRTSIEQQVWLFYGVPKIGKSTLCSKFDKPLYIATEPGTNHLDLEYEPTFVTNWKSMLQVCGELAKMIAAGECPFKTIVIDTVDELSRYCTDYILEREGIAQLGDLPYGQGHAAVRDELARVLKKLSMLGLGMILTSHAKEVEEETKVGLKVKKWLKRTISVSGSRGKDVMAMCDIILYMTSKIEEDGTQKGLVYTKPSMYHDAGDRTGKLPEQIEYSPDNIDGLADTLKGYFK